MRMTPKQNDTQQISHGSLLQEAHYNLLCFWIVDQEDHCNLWHFWVVDQEHNYCKLSVSEWWTRKTNDYSCNLWHRHVLIVDQENHNLDSECTLCVSELCFRVFPEQSGKHSVSSVSVTVTWLLLMACVSSVSETRPDTQCIWCIRGPPPVYLSSRSWWCAGACQTQQHYTAWYT